VLVLGLTAFFFFILPLKFANNLYPFIPLYKILFLFSWLLCEKNLLFWYCNKATSAFKIQKSEIWERCINRSFCLFKSPFLFLCFQFWLFRFNWRTWILYIFNLDNIKVPKSWDVDFLGYSENSSSDIPEEWYRTVCIISHLTFCLILVSIS